VSGAADAAAVVQTILARARKHKNDRIEQIETGLRDMLLGRSECGDVTPELRQLAIKFRLRRASVLDGAWHLWESISPHVRYRPARWESHRGRVQHLRRPCSIVSVGEDCDGLNLVLFGGILREHFGSDGLHSVYLPNQLAPRHVVLGVDDPLGTGRWLFDICDQPGFAAQRGPARAGLGYWVPWEF
jgi:hypothetical protein